jgi:hypothetical protein
MWNGKIGATPNEDERGKVDLPTWATPVRSSPGQAETRAETMAEINPPVYSENDSKF